MKFWGVYQFLIGVLFAVDSFVGMMPAANGSLPNWWGPVTLASAILLALEGLRRLLPWVHSGFFIGLAAVVPIVLSNFVDGLEGRVWILAVALAFVEWSLTRLADMTGHEEVGSLVLTSILTIALLNTTVSLFKFYWESPWMWPLGRILGFMVPIALPWTLIIVLLVHAASNVTNPGRNEIKAQ